jgi:hypothetical protein
MLKTYCLIGGYSGSGKTTVLNELGRLGYPCFSSSQLLYQFVNSLAVSLGHKEHPFKPINRLRKATLSTQINLHGDNFGNREYITKTVRDWMITFSEDSLVKVFGRQVYCGAIVPQARITPSSLVFIEVFNEEEAMLYERAFSPAYGNESNLVFLNLRRETENPTIDSRVLIPGVDIDNNQPLDFTVKKILEISNATP